MTKTNLSNIPQVSLEQLITLPIERLIELEKEADNELREADIALKEAKGVKDWIARIMAIQNVVQSNNTDNNQQIIYGGENAKTTDYLG